MTDTALGGKADKLSDLLIADAGKAQQVFTNQVTEVQRSKKLVGGFSCLRASYKPVLYLCIKPKQMWQTSALPA